jgi:hypothetical protein
VCVENLCCHVDMQARASVFVRGGGIDGLWADGRFLYGGSATLGNGGGLNHHENRT